MFSWDQYEKKFYNLGIWFLLDAKIFLTIVGFIVRVNWGYLGHMEMEPGFKVSS